MNIEYYHYVFLLYIECATNSTNLIGTFTPHILCVRFVVKILAKRSCIGMIAGKPTQTRTATQQHSNRKTVYG